MDKKNAGKALETICTGAEWRMGTGCFIPEYEEGDPAFSVRFCDSDYEGGKLGLPPSVVLSSEDLLSNPELLIFLLGESEGYRQHRMDNNKILWFSGLHRRRNEDVKQKSIKRAYVLSSEVASLASKERRNEIGGWRFNTSPYKQLRDKASGLEIEFKEPQILVAGKPLYEIDIISNSSLALKEIEEKMEKLEHNSKAMQQLENGRRIHKERMAGLDDSFYPTFTIME